jgi:N-acetylmuramoyl-L-alanine amidase
MRIGIDPGHGGRDPGAIGPTRLYEKDVTLGISLELGRLLKAAGLEPVFTRTDDRTVELFTRSALLNNQKCSLAISVHINSATRQEANYFAVFVQKLGGEAEKLAHRVIEKVTAATGWSWGADDDGIREKNLHMVRETKMPAILIECGFISNPEQEKQLRQPEMQKKLAQAIADGVLAYLGKEKGGSAVADVKVIVKGKELPGKLIDNRTWVPLRELVKALNNQVIWDKKDRTAVVK